MSSELDKEKHSRRFFDDELHVKKNVKLAKAHNVPVKRGEEHRLYKCSGMNCGKSTCHMCGNPRKFFKEPTIKEKSFAQTQHWTDADETV